MPQIWLAPVRLGLGAGERGVQPTLFRRYRPNPHHPGGGNLKNVAKQRRPRELICAQCRQIKSGFGKLSHARTP